MDGGIEVFCVGEGLVGEMMGFQVMPDNFDVVEFGRIFGQPFDGEPVLARRERCFGGQAGVDGALSSTMTTGRPVWPGRGP